MGMSLNTAMTEDDDDHLERAIGYALRSAPQSQFDFEADMSMGWGAPMMGQQQQSSMDMGNPRGAMMGRPSEQDLMADAKAFNLESKAIMSNIALNFMD